MDAVWAQIIIVSVVSPAVMAVILAVIRRSEKNQDYKRQDDVAKQLVQRQDAIAAKVAEAARLLAESDHKTNKKLDGIHDLVDGGLTEVKQAELDATIRVLVLLKEVAALKRTAGAEPSVEALAAIEATRAKVKELQDALALRAQQATALAAAAVPLRVADEQTTQAVDRVTDAIRDIAKSPN